MIHIIEGPSGSGKTSLLGRLAAEWRARGRPVEGVLSLRRVDGAGRTDGYDLLDLRTGRVRPLLRRGGPTDAPRVGAWVFDGAGLAAADAAIRRAARAVILVVDECGPLELAGGGFRPALDAVLDGPERDVVIAVRPGLAAAVLEAVGRGRPAAVHALADPGTAGRLADAFGRSASP